MSAWLPDAECRCRNRLYPCSHAERCARDQADIGQWTPVADFSRDIKAGACRHFEVIRRKPEPEPERPNVKPWPGD